MKNMDIPKFTNLNKKTESNNVIDILQYLEPNEEKRRSQ